MYEEPEMTFGGVITTEIFFLALEAAGLFLFDWGVGFGILVVLIMVWIAISYSIDGPSINSNLKF